MTAQTSTDCGQPNMYMFPHKCIVTGATGTTPLAPAQPPVWCEDDQTKCILGAKQMIFWNQFDGNNVVLEGTQLNGESKSPNYNSKMGFTDGESDDLTDSVNAHPSTQAPRLTSSPLIQQRHLFPTLNLVISMYPYPHHSHLPLTHWRSVR